MNAVATVMNRLFDVLTSPFGDHAGWAMLLLSLASGVLLLWLFKVTTNQKRLAAVRERMVGHVYELGLYQDDLGAMLRIQRDLALANLRYLGLTLPALLTFIPPVVLILAQLDARFAHRPLQPGETVLVTATVAPIDAELLERLVITTRQGLVIESPPVRDRRRGTATWRLRAEHVGHHTLEIIVRSADGGASPTAPWTKDIVVGSGLPAISPTRERGAIVAAIFRPAEKPLPAQGLITSISADLPARDLRIAGFRMHWLLAFCVISLVGGLAFKNRLRVVI